jgi:Tfp pilus assembly protein PilF
MLLQAKHHLVLTLLVVSIACVSQRKAVPPEPTLQAAMSRMQANDITGAAKILEEVVEREPRNGRAWRNLGLTQLKLKALDRSTYAFRRSLEVEPDVPTPLLQLAAISALKQDREAAFDWLSKAKATRKIDMTQMDSTPELASLKGDPRYSALLPTRKDFDDPFVEPVTIIREWDGESTNDQFGWIARNIGDVDGDGVPDFVTSAPTSKAAGEERIYPKICR